MLSSSDIANNQQERQWALYAHKQRLRQTVADSQTTFVGFWRGYRPDDGLHVVELVDGSTILCTSITNSGFIFGSRVLVRRPLGAVYGMILQMPRV